MPWSSDASCWMRSIRITWVDVKKMHMPIFPREFDFQQILALTTLPPRSAPRKIVTHSKRMLTNEIWGLLRIVPVIRGGVSAISVGVWQRTLNPQRSRTSPLRARVVLAEEQYSSHRGRGHPPSKQEKTPECGTCVKDQRVPSPRLGGRAAHRAAVCSYSVSRHEALINRDPSSPRAAPVSEEEVTREGRLSCASPPGRPPGNQRKIDSWAIT